MFLTDLADACRKSGLEVVELPGWKNRGRPASSGDFDPEGVLCHHTGGFGDGRRTADSMALSGRPDLPPPLCQLALDRQGIVYVCAAGRANHAGKAKAHGTITAGDGNELYVGIEAMNTGSEGWSAAQYDAYVRLVAALCSHYGWSPENVAGHKETSVTGKIDPGGIDMDDFRADVAIDMVPERPEPKRRPARVVAVLEAMRELRDAAEDAGKTARAAKVQAHIDAFKKDLG